MIHKKVTIGTFARMFLVADSWPDALPAWR